MGGSLKCLSWSAAERYASAARTVVHLIVGPARDERWVVLSLSCGARPRPGYPQRHCTLRMPVARPGWRYRRPGEPRNFGLHRVKQLAVVRRRAEPVAGAVRTVTPSHLGEALAGARAVVLTLALTPQSYRMIGQKELELMDQRAWLVNVARGALVDTAALVGALRSKQIGGAALDVTDPEPLPAGHPLWDLPNCLITPHTADTEQMTEPLLAARIAENVRRLAAGHELVGRVDPDLGY